MDVGDAGLGGQGLSGAFVVAGEHGDLVAVRAEAGDDFGALMAAAVIMTAPLVIAFLLAQRRFVEGIATTGLKG